jgi:glycosyltransferase involved in cell wall biosynthesis
VHIVVIWQRFLPYHVARLTHLAQKLAEAGHRLTAVEVAVDDHSYGFPDASSKEKEFEHVCCFGGSSYHDHRSREIFKAVSAVLEKISPDVVLAPATPFPEGMAAVVYRCRFAKRVVMMDDAWEYVDKSGLLERSIKRQIHQNIDAAFIPAPSHRDYFREIGFPADRIVCGVDVVDNEYFWSEAESARKKEKEWRQSLSLFKNYFLFVGRFIEKKGIEDLIASYSAYRTAVEDPWDLVCVGAGPDMDATRKRAADMEGIQIVGPRHDDTLCVHYALASVLVVPSRCDQWCLVINEGLASGLPVIASRGCGAAQTLVREGENGWIFDPGDTSELSAVMQRASTLPSEGLRRMGDRSRAIVAEWSLDRFAEGVLEALKISRRASAGVISNLLVKLWKGHIIIT